MNYCLQARGACAVDPARGHLGGAADRGARRRALWANVHRREEPDGPCTPLERPALRAPPRFRCQDHTLIGALFAADSAGAITYTAG